MLSITQPFTVALRATQQSALPLIASVTALGTNTFLNWVFIFGNLGAPALGVEGAALATAIARLLEMLIILFEVFGLRNKIAGSLKDFFGYSRDLATRIVKNALPTTTNETLWGIGTSLYIAAFARIGIAEGAAVQACNTINNMFTLAAFSVGDAILILVGQKLGEGKPELAYTMSKKMIKIGLVIGIVMGAGVIAAGEPLLSLFSFSPGRRIRFQDTDNIRTDHVADHIQCYPRDWYSEMRRRYQIRHGDGDCHGVAHRCASGIHNIPVSAMAYISGSVGCEAGGSS